MRYHPTSKAQVLDPELLTLLVSFREKRNFDPSSYLSAKVEKLNHYFQKHSLAAAVVAVSGGIDSAVVLGIVANATTSKSSPIRTIVPLLLPVHQPGATNQKSATTRGQKVVKHFHLKPLTLDLTKAFRELTKAEKPLLNKKKTPWADGQRVSYLRTPALYYATSLLTERGLPALICGTTNYDEGSYLGYFGKASDGMVDLQLISDLHKSEVYSLARYLKIPKALLEVTPTGDMFDGRVDEEVFGAPYDFVELYLSYLALSPSKKAKLLASLSLEVKKQFSTLAASLEALHSYNSHKYLAASPALHLDLTAHDLPGGWRTNRV